MATRRSSFAAPSYQLGCDADSYFFRSLGTDVEADRHVQRIDVCWREALLGKLFVQIARLARAAQASHVCRVRDKSLRRYRGV